MTAPDFKSLLSRPLDEVKRPPILPPGTYFGTITAFRYQESPWINEKTGYPDAQVCYTIRNLEAGPDLTPELLQDIDLLHHQMIASLPLSGGNEYVTKAFLDSLDITTSGGRGFGETCPEALSHEVMFDVVHRLNKNDPAAPPRADVRYLRAKP